MSTADERRGRAIDKLSERIRELEAQLAAAQERERGYARVILCAMRLSDTVDVDVEDDRDIDWVWLKGKLAALAAAQQEGE